MNLSDPLPPWPEIDSDAKGKSFRDQIKEWNEVTGAMNGYYCEECCYIATDADRMLAATMARLRLATEALRAIADHCSKQEHWLFDSIEDGADATLARIGPLPEPQP